MSQGPNPNNLVISFNSSQSSSSVKTKSCIQIDMKLKISRAGMPEKEDSELSMQSWEWSWLVEVILQIFCDFLLSPNILRGSHMNGWLQVIHVLCKNCLLYKCATICPTYAGGHLGCFQLLAIGGKKCCDMSPDTQSTFLYGVTHRVCISTGKHPHLVLPVFNFCPSSEYRMAFHYCFNLHSCDY